MTKKFPNFSSRKICFITFEMTRKTCRITFLMTKKNFPTKKFLANFDEIIIFLILKNFSDKISIIFLNYSF